MTFPDVRKLPTPGGGIGSGNGVGVGVGDTTGPGEGAGVWEVVVSHDISIGTNRNTKGFQEILVIASSDT
jgi:hypothetical protein